MPTQKCLRRHDQAIAAPLWEQTSKRSKERPIRRPQWRSAGLPAKHDELMAQHEQLDVFGELTTPTAYKQPQNSREREVRKGKKHPPMLPEPTAARQTDEPRF
jgi:hypothetical protein